MRRTVLIITLFLLLSSIFFTLLHSIHAQQASQAIVGSSVPVRAPLSQTLKELTNPFSILSIAAHSDDADYRALAYYRNKFGAHISVLFATRDESGGDATSNLLSGGMGVAKTREALRACDAIGADAYFLNFRDVGHTKSADEVWNQWEKDEALAKLVQAIRRLRPDIIITSHNGKSGDGYQQALGQLLLVAFGASADTKVATVADSEVWQPKRLYHKTDFGDSDTFINLLEFNHLTGGSFSETGPLISTSKKELREADKSYYKLALAATGDKPPFGAAFLDGLSLPEKLQKSLSPPTVNGRPILEALTERERLTEALIENLIEKRAEGSLATIRERYGADFFRVVRYIETLERALALTLGISFELRLTDRMIAQGDALSAELIFHNGGNNPMSLVFHTPEALAPKNSQLTYQRSQVRTVPPYSKTVERLRYDISKDFPPTLPHSQRLYEEQFYPATALRLSQEPFGSSLAAFAEVNLGQTTLFLPALQKYDVAPPVEISVMQPFILVQDWTASREVEVIARLRNRVRGGLKGALWIVPQAVTDNGYEPLHVSFLREDEEAVVKLRLKVPIIKPPLSPDILVEFRRERPAPPDALAAIKIPVRAIDCNIVENLRVAYGGEADSPLAAALAVLGVNKTLITSEEISTSQHGGSDSSEMSQVCSDLSSFDTIIVDALTYSANPNWLAKNHCLLAYVRRGGNLVVLYQRPEFWDFLFSRSLFTPFSFALSNDHLTNESSPVKILNVDHPLMKKPNALSEKDFEGWSRNRAFYLPKHWATDYEALLEAADPGEEARKGLILVTRYEAGSFVYTSLDLSKQLAESHVGAFRILANLLSLPRALKEKPAK